MRRSSWLVMGLMLFVWACETGSPYERLVKRELNSGQVNDSLFLTFKFGDSREDFFKKGWEQNKMGLIAQGPRNMNIKYVMPNSEKGNSPIQMLFYPIFDEDQKIKTMNISFNYTGWAPWNRKFFSDSLAYAVQDSLMNWYGGNPFLEVPLEAQENSIWVKVDGNRLISLGIADEQNVKGYIKDLNHPDNQK